MRFPTLASRSAIFIIVAAMTFFQAACSTLKGEKSVKDLSMSGPNIVNARLKPGTIELDRNLRPIQKAEIVAEVKDFNSAITDVRLRFDRVPIEVKMKKVSGTTWQAELPSGIFKQLAIGDQTTVYEAKIFAKNAAGNMGVTEDPVKIAVKTPNLSTRAG